KARLIRLEKTCTRARILSAGLSGCADDRCLTTEPGALLNVALLAFTNRCSAAALQGRHRKYRRHGARLGRQHDRGRAVAALYRRRWNAGILPLLVELYRRGANDLFRFFVF